MEIIITPYGLFFHSICIIFNHRIYSFSELLTTAALYGAANNIMSIFISKAVYQYRDSTQIEVVTPDNGPLHSNVTADEIAGKYSLLPDD